MVGTYNFDPVATWFDWDDDKMNLASRFGILHCPSLALVPPDYVVPENRTVKPVLWDGTSDWRLWLSQQLQKMPKPEEDERWSEEVLHSRDATEAGEWTRCFNF